MEMLQYRVGVPIEHQRLVHETRQLDPDHGYTLAHYGIRQGSHLHLTLRLLGGRAGHSAAFADVSKPGEIVSMVLKLAYEAVAIHSFSNRASILRQAFSLPDP